MSEYYEGCGKSFEHEGDFFLFGEEEDFGDTWAVHYEGVDVAGAYLNNIIFNMPCT